MSELKRVPRILVGVDDRPPGQAALDLALDQADRRGASVHLVRVSCDIDWLFSATAADIAKLEASAAKDAGILADAVHHTHEVAPNLEVVSELVTGDLFEQLNARTADADLLVIGSDEDPTAGNLVGDWFTDHADCPVEVVSAGHSSSV